MTLVGIVSGRRTRRPDRRVKRQRAGGSQLFTRDDRGYKCGCHKSDHCRDETLTASWKSIILLFAIRSTIRCIIGR